MKENITNYPVGSKRVWKEGSAKTEKVAAKASNRQILATLKALWKNKYIREKAEWDQDPKWPAKLVHTSFKLRGIEYTIYPSDIGLSTDPWDQGFMETIQNDMEKDLMEYGATDIFSVGFLD